LQGRAIVGSPQYTARPDQRVCFSCDFLQVTITQFDDAARRDSVPRPHHRPLAATAPTGNGLDPVRAETSSTSCDNAVFVDQAIDMSPSADAVLVEVDRVRVAVSVARRRAGSGAAGADCGVSRTGAGSVAVLGADHLLFGVILAASAPALSRRHRSARPRV
jgi:hypothetical protein